MTMISVMHARITALAFALLATLSGCDADDGAAEPVDGSCQMLVSDAIANDDADTSCWIPLGITNGTADTPESAARCVARLFGLESPPADEVSGLAYQVAYQALCDIHGDEMPQYCEVSETLGCDG